MNGNRRIGCIVVAAGRGTRAGLGHNKVFEDICGRSVLSRTLDALTASGLIDEIVPVLSESDIPVYEAMTAREGACPLVRRTAPGGSTRRDSVYSGLKALDCDIVLVHDAVRMFVTKDIIAAVIADAARYGSSVISMPVTDTIKMTDGHGNAVSTPERSLLRAVQTPQAFDYRKLLAAYDACPPEAVVTDDASVYERMYSSVRLTETPDAKDNIKLTYARDFDEARGRIMGSLMPRMGTGYDVHRLVEGRKLILCGVEIPYEKGLLGHSDADVALHALMDALLGAAAMGDIGKLFPDTDDSYKGISSLILLSRTADAIKKAGFVIGSCDLTIVCQRPKLAPFITEMRENIARTLGIAVDRVSVKATTTEKLGFEGEGLGISAQSAAVIFGGR